MVKEVKKSLSRKTVPVKKVDRRTREYRRHKEAARERQATISRTGRDIGEIPQCQDKKMRARMKEDLMLFLKTCMPETFSLPWSKNHYVICGNIQSAFINRGNYVIVAPRSEGKSSICIGAAQWALLNGYAKFLIYVGPSKEAAQECFQAIKTELETNEKLLAYYPEAVYPIQKLEGQSNRAAGQICNGEKTGIRWESERIVFPTVAGSPSSGAVLIPSGFDGRLRGRQMKTRDGQTLRPDAVIFDDVQKDRTSRNPKTADYLEKLLKGTVKYMGTRTKRLAMIIPGTRLNKTCFMSRMLDRRRNPSYQGTLLKAIEQFPENLELWKDYWKAWCEEAERLDVGGNLEIGEAAWDKARTVANDFYKRHRAQMDKGAIISWPDNIGQGDLSALQTLMNMYLDDEATFMTEFQNDPQTDALDSVQLTEEIFYSKVIQNLKPGTVPLTADRITLGMDLHKNLIFWIVAAWGSGFTGHIVAHGTYPKQPYSEFTVENAPVTLESTHPGLSFEGQLYAGMKKLTDELYGRNWMREDGVPLKINLGLVDANWSRTTDTILSFVNRNPNLSLYPSRGRKSTGRFYPDKKKMESWTNFSYLTKRTPTDLAQTVWVNANKAKSFALQRLVSGLGEVGSMTIHAGTRDSLELLFQHLTSQYYTPHIVHDETIEYWELLPGRIEDHWWDCLCLSIVANAMLGDALDVNDRIERRRRNNRKVFKR